MHNIEIKGIYPDLERGRALAERLGAKHMGMLHQTDTYFGARFGRLKLREIEGQPSAELISYHREDASRARLSDYEIVSIDDPGGLIRALARTLTVEIVVRKARDLWIWNHVRIHLDKVEQLGSFIEFEAVMETEADEKQGVQTVEKLMQHFSIDPAHVKPGSYADLLREASAAVKVEP